MNSCLTGSNPRTYSSVGSARLNWPQPRRLLPWSSWSRPASTLDPISENVILRCRLKPSGRKFICMSSDGVQGPRQLLRPATVPSCDVRQSRTLDGELAINSFIAEASAGSAVVAGLNMNARSLCEPSPLMSPDTIGVNGAPELRRAFAVISSQSLTGFVKYVWMVL